MKGLDYYGQVELPKQTVQDGKIINKKRLLETVNRLVTKRKWKRKNLFFAVPDNTVVIREMKIPVALTKEEAIGYLSTQIGENIHLPFENPAIDVEFLEKNEEEREILLFAYPKERITDFQEVFSEVGLKPVAADLTSLSIYRYYIAERTEKKKHILLIHWNSDALFLTAFQSDKAIFTRHIKIDFDQIELSNEEMISDHIIEIQRIMDFYRFSVMNGEAGIECILITGDFSRLNEARKIIKETVNTELYAFELPDTYTKFIDLFGLGLKPMA